MTNVNRALRVLPLLALLGACAPKNDGSSDADAFRSALPTADHVKLDTPGAASAGSQAQSFSPGVRLTGDGPAARAQFYQLTRDLFDGVNLGTGWVLGTVWIIAQLPPTSIDGDTCTWGPGDASALEPAVWRLRITQTTPGVFSYVFEGRPKNDASAPFVATLHGTGYGKTHERHGDGSFVIDWDAANQIDPGRLGADSEDGTVTVDYHLMASPQVIAADIKRSATPAWYTVTTTRETDGSGRVDLDAHGDIDTPADGKLEDVVMKSRWLATGAGRADVVVSGGSIPDAVGMVKISECWSPSFGETYWGDSATLRPTLGTVDRCAYADAAF